jgi:hypothetical protein
MKKVYRLLLTISISQRKQNQQFLNKTGNNFLCYIFVGLGKIFWGAHQKKYFLTYFMLHFIV